MTIKPVHVRDFLKAKNAPPSKLLPLVHTTESSKLIGFLNKKKILATKCNVFKGEKLTYLFVGRPAYKWEVPGTDSDYWMLPTVFVLRFQNPPSFKRVYPFDSGAFTAAGRFPRYITTFKRDDFELDPKPDEIKKLVSVFFKSEERYWKRQPSSPRDFKDENLLGPLHAEVEALNKLYGERSGVSFDDRAAAVEVQIADDIPLVPGDVLGIVVPDEYLRERAVKDALKAITPNIRGYPLFPTSVDGYFTLIYNEVHTIYKSIRILP